MIACEWVRASNSAFLGLITGLMLVAATVEAQGPCLGDCDGSGAVTVDEIITLVSIGLGQATVDACSAGDGDSSGTITVDEIVTGTTNALQGCPVVGGPLGMHRFVLDPVRSNFTAVLAPGFEITLGSFRGQTNGVVEDAFVDFEAGEPDENGIAVIDITAASEYIFANASIANITLCVKPVLPVEAAGVVQCNGGNDYSIDTSIDHVAGRIGENDFTLADCSDLGGTLEGPNQVCAAGSVGTECFVNSDCDTTFGAGDGMCGLTTGRCPGGPLGPGAPCNTNDDCDGATCTPVTCTEGKVGEPCRNAGDCDSAAGADDGICGEPDPHPGACNGPLSFGQIGGDSGPGSVIFAPLEGLQGLPVELGIESAPPCGDEGPGAFQPFAMTTGISRTTVRHFSAGDDDLTFTQTGANFDCSNWQNDMGGKFVLSFPTIHLNPMGGGDLVVGLAFQGR
jgi:hypothetical protein